MWKSKALENVFVNVLSFVVCFVVCLLFFSNPNFASILHSTSPINRPSSSATGFHKETMGLLRSSEDSHTYKGTQHQLLRSSRLT